MSPIPLGILAASGGGGAAAYELISTTVLGASQASVTFSGLGTSAAAYKHLQLRMVVRTDRGFADDRMIYRFNSDTGSNYAYHQLRGNGADVSGGDVGGTSATGASTGRISGGSSAASSYAGCVLDVLDFASTTKNKTARSLTGMTSNNYISLDSGLWMSTSAVTSITLLSAFSANFVSGSRFSLYGIRGS